MAFSTSPPVSRVAMSHGIPTFTGMLLALVYDGLYKYFCMSYRTFPLPTLVCIRGVTQNTSQERIWHSLSQFSLSRWSVPILLESPQRKERGFLGWAESLCSRDIKPLVGAVALQSSHTRRPTLVGKANGVEGERAVKQPGITP